MVRKLFVLAAILSGGAGAPAVAWQQAPEAIQPYKWMVIGERLMFARPDSGDIPLSFKCKQGSARVEVEVRTGKSSTKMMLLSQGQQASFAATWDDGGEEFGDPYLKTNSGIALSHPVISAFRKSGQISEGSPAYAFRQASPAEMADIERFFAYCEQDAVS